MSGGGDGGELGGGAGKDCVHCVGLSVGKSVEFKSTDCPWNGAAAPYPKLSCKNVPPKLLSRAMELTNKCPSLCAIVMM